jgi:hypothetical protein
MATSVIAPTNVIGRSLRPLHQLTTEIGLFDPIELSARVDPQKLSHELFRPVLRSYSTARNSSAHNRCQRDCREFAGRSQRPVDPKLVVADEKTYDGWVPFSVYSKPCAMYGADRPPLEQPLARASAISVSPNHETEIAPI